MTGIAHELSAWAVDLVPTDSDVELTNRSLLDTVSVAVAARNEPTVRIAGDLSEPARWATAAHVLDFDDLHMPSTTHISAVCLPAALATDGDARAYLAGAGVMARIGTALGWSHYAAGWHATSTSGALAAAVAAGIGLGLDARRLTTAMALAVPAAGGVQRAFGTDAKSLQIGFAAEAGVRAARLAADGATADPGAVDSWLELVGGDPNAVIVGGPAVPDGLAVKMFPCCYALQRPISSLSALAGDRVDPAQVCRVVVRTPKATVAPLLHHRPDTGLEAKFSMEYAVATTLLDGYPGFWSFTDAAVARPEARRLMELVEVQLSDGGDWLLAGELEVEVHLLGEVLFAREQYPPGSPQRPPTPDELARKVRECLAGTGIDPGDIDWSTASRVLRHWL